MKVTQDDRVLCDECAAEQLDEQDPTTHTFASLKKGVCESCGREEK
jgi:hypothetical protein